MVLQLLSLLMICPTEDIIVSVGTVEAGAEFSYGFKITGQKLGNFTLVAGLGSDKAEMTTGEKEVSQEFDWLQSLLQLCFLYVD